MNQRVKKLTTLAALSAVAYLVMLVGRFPVVSFLKYDPKDVVIVISGFIFGPLSAAAMSLVVSVVEMLTVSNTGFWGLLMNVLSTCAFACTASLIYRRRPSLSGAILGLVAGTVLMVGTMLLWNYFITPFYLAGVSRTEVAGMLATVFLPFNLLKAGLNSAVTMLLYRPVVSALRKARLIPALESVKTPSGAAGKHRVNAGVILAAAVVLVTCVMLVLVLNGTL